MRLFRADNAGQSIVEVVISIGILAVGGSAVALLVLSAFRGVGNAQQQTQASAIVRQSWEAVQSISRARYNALVPGTYGLTDAGGSWAFAGSSDVQGDFTRSVLVETVTRDGSGNVAGSGTNDVHTRKVTSTVSWLTPIGTKSVQSVDYLSNWDRRRFFHDLTADFTPGTFSNTETDTTVDSDGAVRLAALPPSLWACFEADGLLDLAGTVDATAVAVSGSTAYVGLPVNGGGAEFFVVDIATPGAPVLLGSLELGANVNGIAVSGTTVFLATSDNAAEMRVVSVATPATPTSIGTLNLSGNTDALDVAVSGSRAYLTRANDAAAEFFSVNVTTPSTPATLGSVELGSNSREVKLSGTNAFVVTNGDATEFRVVNVSVDAAPTVSATIDLPSAADGMDLDISGTKAYVVTAVNGTGSEFYVIDITTPASPTTSGSVDLGNGANAVVMDGTSAMVASSGVAATKTIQYVDAAVAAAPVVASSQRLGTVDTLALAWNGSRLFAATGENAAELMVINRQSTTDWGCMQRRGLFNAGAAAQAVYVVGTTAYVTTTSVAGPDFYILNVSDPANPTQVGSLDLGANGNDVVVSGNFAYVASSDNAAELKVINISTPATPTIAGSLNLAGTTDGQAVNISGTKLFLTQGATFFNVNVAAPATPATLGSVAIAGIGFRIETLSSSVAYVATAGDAAEVQVMNVSGNTPSVTTSFNAAGTADGRALWIKGGTLYLATDVNASGGEFYVLDITAPAAPSLTGTLELGITARAAAADDDEPYAFAGTTTATRALSAVSTTTPSTPTVDGIVPDIAFAVNDLFFLSDTLYLATADTAAEFMTYKKPVQGGGGGGGFQSSGTFTSAALDATDTANWNTIEWSQNLASCPSGTIQLQVRTATTSGGLTGELWQGPDGEDADQTDFFTDPAGALVHVSHDADQFMQYRATFAGPGTCTPYLTDFTLTYTPY